MAGDVVSASARGVSFLILVQVVSRALTFALNQSLLRYISPALFGASTQLDLFVITVLYFSRESVRFALQRYNGKIQVTINMAYLPLLIGAPFELLTGIVYARTFLPEVGYVKEALLIYAASAIIELLAEPSFAIAQQLLLYNLRAQNETFATIARCLCTFACVYVAHLYGSDIGILPFAYGQLAYASTLFLCFSSRVVLSTEYIGVSLWPTRINEESVSIVSS